MDGEHAAYDFQVTTLIPRFRQVETRSPVLLPLVRMMHEHKYVCVQNYEKMGSTPRIL
jgi:hypothetical protein